MDLHTHTPKYIHTHTHAYTHGQIHAYAYNLYARSLVNRGIQRRTVSIRIIAAGT